MWIFILAFIVLWSTPGYMMRPSSSKAQSNEEIDHTHFLLSDISNLYLSNSFSDVVLDLNGVQLQAHRVLLASRSEYFSDLLYKKNKKTDERGVKISDVPVTLVKLIHKYIYTGRIDLSVLEGLEDCNLPILRGVNSYFWNIVTENLCNKMSYMMRPSSSKSQSNQEIDHTHILVSDMSNLYVSGSFSDVTLVVEKEQLSAHRFLLASRSKYFSGLLYGGNRETYDLNVPISDVPVTLFKILVKYIYTGKINNLNNLKVEELFELHRIADFFGVLNLNHSLYEYLQRSINLQNVCSFLVLSQIYQYKKLEDESLDFIDINALNVLRSENFLTLSSEALLGILNRDTFYSNEFYIFNEVCRWITENEDNLDRDSKIEVLSAVRYHLMSDKELADAKELKLVTPDIILDAIEFRNTLSTAKHQFRGQLKPDVYIYFVSRRSSDSHGFSDLYKKYGTNMIKLNTLSTINFIELSLWSGRLCRIDRLKCYSYYVEVSIDLINWTRVINYSNYNCRDFQRLWFPSCIARYIRIIETKNNTDAPFKIWCVEYNTIDKRHVEIENGFVIPKVGYNVISKYNNAIVIQGDNNNNNEGSIVERYTYYEDKARNDSYTWHRLGSDGIVVHLTQPFILSSMRLLLWGGDKQAYTYTVESSLDNQNWQMLVDNTEEPKRSWQILKFDPTPMLYIRITGITNSAGNDFRCVYLEAPNQEI